MGRHPELQHLEARDGSGNRFVRPPAKALVLDEVGGERVNLALVEVNAQLVEEHLDAVGLRELV